LPKEYDKREREYGSSHEPNRSRKVLSDEVFPEVEPDRRSPVAARLYLDGIAASSRHVLERSDLMLARHDLGSARRCGGRP
jgi:hypothetical protein